MAAFSEDQEKAFRGWKRGSSSRVWGYISNIMFFSFYAGSPYIQ
jgi:hypothetical protein